MTCIVGIVDGNSVHMGADSAGVAGTSLSIRADPKIFKKGSMVIGCTSSYRMIQLIRFKLVLPSSCEGLEGADLFEYMCTVFVDAIRVTFRDGGYLRKEHEVETGGNFLVGVGGRLFSVEEDYQVSERAYNFDAIGSGRDAALGSLWSTRYGTAASRIEDALNAAEAFCTGVRGPFVYASQEPPVDDVPF